ncbi:MAG TPA: 16S rRNA (adenine(1518)-N(6)/adenine(1519)-N(6))-dimethyltransferase RsmA, partial [Chloroflexota bacterium]|nr:16S rRNA (adenine(1518)-N(6)/adenine(1519)-N(6))-dimethyltransferase RsmA [Chloroflexota bacterium]
PLPESGDEPAPVATPVVPRDVPPRTLPAIKTLLYSLGLRTHKGFGQNILTNDSILDKVVRAADIQPGEVVVEVGPGLGHLTEHLARAAGRVIAVEIDRGFVRLLRTMYDSVPNVEIIEQDVLKFEPALHANGRSYKVVANLPYYLTSVALRHFLENPTPPTTLVVMVQREVATRILAPTDDLNLLAISVRVFGDPRIAARVPASAFFPQPSVESAVLRIDVLNQPRITSAPATFFKVVSSGFATQRKQLHNSLAQRLWIPPGEAPVIIEAAGIDPKRRAQTLSIVEWDQLTLELARRGLV